MLRLTAVLACLVAGCGGSGSALPRDASGADASGPTADAPPHVPGNPGPGAHGLAYFRIESHAETVATPVMSTRGSGSTIIVSTGRGDGSAQVLPTDNQGNAPYVQLGSSHAYTMWPGSGTALYAFAGASGGPDHVVSAATAYDDEVTLAAVEVIDGTTIADHQWNEVLVGNAITSRSVTTTGPSTLVAFWWGDANADDDKTAVPDGGFVVVDSILEAGSLVQCAVAVKEVTAAGTYNVTWTATPAQGAQLWLVAVQ
jgi:hypothetical protein